MQRTRKMVFNLFASSSLLFAASGAHAAEPLALQKVMKDLGKNMQVIIDGISREDREILEKPRP